MKKLRKTKKVMGEARKLLRRVPRAFGECRSVRMCGDCGHLFGRRFIPFGLGKGFTLDACMCQLTGPCPSHVVLETRRGR